MTNKSINREEAIVEIQNSLADEESFLSHLKVGVQKKSDEKIIKRGTELQGIEEYLYLCQEFGDGKQASAKLKSETKLPFSDADMWERAEKNTFEGTTIKSMFEVLTGICGAPEEIIPDAPLYIISNQNQTRGASAILDKKALEEFSKKFKTNKIIALPSSIHEFIIAPLAEYMNIEMLTQMVQEVNSSEVSPEEQLGDRAYILNV